MSDWNPKSKTRQIGEWEGTVEVIVLVLIFVRIPFTGDSQEIMNCLSILSISNNTKFRFSDSKLSPSQGFPVTVSWQLRGYGNFNFMANTIFSVSYAHPEFCQFPTKKWSLFYLVLDVGLCDALMHRVWQSDVAWLWSLGQKKTNIVSLLGFPLLASVTVLGKS